jgi:serine-type D-Ala-D-Ala carboxypeptidase (penicillin-binding protein 5/6)
VAASLLTAGAATLSLGLSTGLSAAASAAGRPASSTTQTTATQTTTAAAAIPTPTPVGGPGLAGPGVLVDQTTGVPAPPSLAAASYLLADLDTGDVLVAKAPHARHLPASTLKVLTALTVMPRLDPAQVVTAVPDDVVDGSLVGLVPGLTYTVQQLLEGMMLSSGNDAATALAREAGGTQGVAATVAAMQQTADHLGARDTVVRDPSGLDAPGQATSAYDLALIAREALRNPHFEALVSTRRVRFPGKPVVAKAKSGTASHATTAAASGTATAPPKRASFEIQNHNTLLYNYDGAIGVKNGYTVAARWTIVGAAERDGRRYVVTALRRSDRSWRPTAALLDWAFTYGSQVQPVGRLVDPGELDQPVSAGATAPATALAVGASTGASIGAATGQSAPHRWVGAAGLAGAAALLGLMAVRARRRLPASRGPVSVLEPRTPPRARPDPPS